MALVRLTPPRVTRLLLVAFAVAVFPLPSHCATTPTEAKALNAAAGDNTAYTLLPDKLVKATAKDRAGTMIHFGDSIWSIVSLILILTLGIAARIRDLAVRVSSNRGAQCFVFVFLLLLLINVLDLPFTLYGQWLELHYGLSVQSWGSFFGDRSKAFGLSYVIGGPIVMLLFRVIRKSPQRWWFWFWLPTMVFVLAGIFITPYVIDPLFNKFQPLVQTNPALVAELEKVVARGGMRIPPSRMFLMKASDKVTTLNAYVTGFGASKRIVVWDTSVAKGTPDEIAFIFGHEMGHYVLGHIVRNILFTFVLLLLQFWAGYQGLQWLLRRYGDRWRIPSQNDWAALVVLLLVVSAISFFTEPVQSAFSRGMEHAADVYGQEAVHGIVADPQTTARDAFRLLGGSSLDTPYPNRFVVFWTYSHPSISRRAAFAAYYDPWKPGEAPKYFAR